MPSPNITDNAGTIHNFFQRRLAACMLCCVVGISYWVSIHNGENIHAGLDSVVPVIAVS